MTIDKELNLTPIEMKDAKEVFAAFDARVIEFLPLESPPRQIEETESFIRAMVKQREEGEDLVWVIRSFSDFIGCCGIHTIKSRRPHFGLWIKHEQQHKGYGKKVVNHMLKWALENLDIDFIKYPVDKRNFRSIKIIEDYGAVLSAEYEEGEKKKLQILEYRLFPKKIDS